MTVLVTGAFGGSGRWIVDRLAREGARLVELRSTRDTPLEGYEDWVYRGMGRREGEDPL